MKKLILIMVLFFGSCCLCKPVIIIVKIPKEDIKDHDNEDTLLNEWPRYREGIDSMPGLWLNPDNHIPPIDSLIREMLKRDTIRIFKSI